LIFKASFDRTIVDNPGCLSAIWGNSRFKSLLYKLLIDFSFVDFQSEL